MPDISMCKGGDCPYKNTCYRFTAIPCKYQTYFSEVPYNFDEEFCQYYWEDV